jgi:hypothetical protein
VLVTGFDPFVSSGAVPAGEVNPSGAAALALDNTQVREGRTTAAVEGVVLPVSFDDFRAGLVENMIRPLVASRGVDAIITVSLDASIAPTAPARIERFVVGVHEEHGANQPISAASPGGIGPAIIEAPAPVEDIARETAQRAGRGSAAIPRPDIGTAVTFRFPNAAVADRVSSAFGLLPQGQRDLDIADVGALQQIVRTMQRSANGTEISFQAAGQVFQATVLSGPGGNFLSNEVSFRTLRLLAEQHRQDLPSFHVHVQRPLEGGGQIPQDTGTPATRRARTSAIAAAMGVRNRLIATLQSMIRALVRRTP